MTDKTLFYLKGEFTSKNTYSQKPENPHYY